MTAEQLYEELKYVNHSRENRLKYAHIIIDNPELIPKVLDILFQVNDKRSARAAWLLEFVARDQLELILPYLDRITSEMHVVHLDSAEEQWLRFTFEDTSKDIAKVNEELGFDLDIGKLALRALSLQDFISGK